MGWGVVMGINITRSVVKCWPKSLRKERTPIYPHFHASEGESGAALTPGQGAAAKVWVLTRKSHLTGIMMVSFNSAHC